MLSVSGYRGIEIKDYDDENRRRSDEDLIGYRIVRPGQLVVNTMWLNYAGLGVSEHEGHVSPAYRAYRFADENADRRFIHHLMRSSAYVLAYTQLLTGIRPNSLQMSRADLMDFPIVLPPQPTQRAIAAFLDREAAKIDALVEEQRRLIALLKEKRQAVVSHAVTKGLDPHAPMKDSGIEWLGDVPEHWAVAALGLRYEVQLGRMLNAERASGDDLRPYLRVADVQWDTINTDDLPLMDFPAEARERYSLTYGDLLVNEGGSYVGRSAIWRAEVAECYYQKALHRVRSRDKGHDTAEFLLFVMEAATNHGVFVASGNQTTIDHLTADQLRTHRFAFPPLMEQEAIALYLRKSVAQIEQLGKQAKQVIALLSERRAALISAAVTGKIDVRESAKVLPFPIDRVRARGLVATEIIERSAHQATFGRVKLQKIAFLTETHVGVSELAGSYTREAAGPLDRAMIDEMEGGARSIAGVTVDQAGGTGTTVRYRLGRQGRAHRNELADYLGADRTAKLDKLIADFAALTTKGAEAVATLYAVWNDALIEGASPTEEDIISGFLNDWHPEKAKKFRADELPEWLGWMRRHGVVPTGTGPKTATERLFA